MLTHKNLIGVISIEITSVEMCDSELQSPVQTRRPAQLKLECAGVCLNIATKFPELHGIAGIY